eukprot:CAMPEP_0195633198 /NCGR_PEP_ID=MMETSP0815-20121206/22007_1 /TAXON_ID=97485 /ORGANISM="Prymnesium parvum, Strain Texoma1" /LENGTH=411 /DNA_ID=CAMNT_0040774823 /DNA_START=31 /DNA_END=1267 /DNA_ORIENTATION=-
MPAATDAHARLADDFGCTRCSPPGQRCGLKFGLFFSKAPSKSHLLDAADYLTVWLGTHSRKFGNGFNPYWHGRMLERVKAQNSTAVFYSYIIAMLARHKSGIRDCDMGSPNLCEHGAQFVRRNEGAILELYEQYANHTARWLGRSAAVVWLMEPDWHQYHESTQRGGGLPQGQMVGLFRQMIARIKRHLPSSRISFDVSPWVVNQREWISPFLQHAQIDFLHTSGGRTTAGSTRVRGNERGNLVTWSELYKVSGRGIIADTGYGVGGKLTTNDDGWSDVANLRARVSDGLVAVSYANVGATWSNKLSRLRRTLPSTKHCFGNPKCLPPDMAHSEMEASTKEKVLDRPFISLTILGRKRYQCRTRFMIGAKRIEVWAMSNTSGLGVAPIVRTATRKILAGRKTNRKVQAYVI